MSNILSTSRMIMGRVALVPNNVDGMILPNPQLWNIGGDDSNDSDDSNGLLNGRLSALVPIKWSRR